MMFSLLVIRQYDFYMSSTEQLKFVKVSEDVALDVFLSTFSVKTFKMWRYRNVLLL